MNGRCDTDPIDRAVDVCDRCYGEFCQDCLVEVASRRHPLCTECALAVSGIRGAGTLILRGERRTAKARRKALKATDDDPRVFEWFDESEAAIEAPVLGPNPVPATAKLAEIKRQGGQDDPSDGSADGPAVRPPDRRDTESERRRRPGSGSDRRRDRRTRIYDTGPAGPPADQRMVSVEPAEAQGGPAAPAAHSGDRAPAAAGPAGTVGAGPDGGSGGQAPSGATTGRTSSGEGAAERRAERPTSGGRPRRPSLEPRPSERRAHADAGAGTAPMIGEVRSVGGRPTGSDRRTRDDEEPSRPGPSRPGRTDGEGTARGHGVDDFDGDRGDGSAPAPVRSAHPAPAEPSDEVHGAGDRPPARSSEREPTGAADRDANGTWIPPILRGMAPGVREAAENLPQRRRGE